MYSRMVATTLLAPATLASQMGAINLQLFAAIYHQRVDIILQWSTAMYWQWRPLDFPGVLWCYPLEHHTIVLDWKASITHSVHRDHIIRDFFSQQQCTYEWVLQSSHDGSYFVIANGCFQFAVICSNVLWEGWFASGDLRQWMVRSSLKRHAANSHLLATMI